MTRHVWPQAFLLYAGELKDDRQLGRVPGILQQLYKWTPPKDGRPPRRGGPTRRFGNVPVALRWSTSPALGFPRAPFQLWRRMRDYVADVKLGGPVSVTSSATVTWTVGTMYEVVFDAAPTAGHSLIVDAIDERGEIIPGERIVFTNGAKGAIRSPGIRGLRVTGQGAIANIAGVDATVLANKPGWDRFEVAGLPFATGEAALPVYDPTPQGPEPPSMTGLDAARFRLTVESVLSIPVPATGLAGVTAPAWSGPDPVKYLQVVRNPGLAPLPLIHACLANTDDSNLAKLQVDYRAHATVAGIHQTGGSGSGDPAQMDIPVVGITILSVSSDSDGATALGYGTIDFPPGWAVSPGMAKIRVPEGASIQSIDYMVTASYTIPYWGTYELAALGQMLPPPQAATGLSSLTFSANRPTARDTAASEAVELSWDLSPTPQGYGVLAAYTGSSAHFLNAARRFGAGGYDPYVPQRPASVGGLTPAGARTTYTDLAAPTAVATPVTTPYLVIGRDVFGRWSPWASTAQVSTPLPVTVPGLTAASLELGTTPTVVGGHVVEGTLVIDFSWDWSDRSPERVELYGKFFAYDAATNPLPAYTGGFQLESGGAAGTAVVVSFGGVNTPSITSGHSGSVTQLTPPAPDGTITPSGDTRRYRARIDNVLCDFSVIPQHAYSVTARGAEHVRPTVLSDIAGPRVARASNPLPANPPTLPIELTWTALPDAAHTARGVLSWPASAGASGYIVWEATEAALRDAVDSTLGAIDRTRTLFARAGDLRALVTANAASQAMSLRAFSRRNERPIVGTSVELALPGSADTLYAYRVSTITPAGMESERSSTIALFAVPRRNQPGQPRLMLRVVKSPTPGIDVIVLPGAGRPADGFRVHRVHNPNITSDVGLMGPPKILPTAGGWADRAIPTLDGSVLMARAVFDAVSASWYPYYYRIVAIGHDDRTNGEYAGESVASAVQHAAIPPATPPLLADILAVSGNASSRVVSFGTDLPVRTTPLGAATIVVAKVAPSTDGKSMQRTPIISMKASDVAEGAPLALLASAAATDLGQIRRGAPDSSGRATYTVRLGADVTRLAITVTDPLARATERQLPES